MDKCYCCRCGCDTAYHSGYIAGLEAAAKYTEDAEEFIAWEFNSNHLEWTVNIDKTKETLAKEIRYLANELE